jgi:hypothetical protein
VAVPVAVVAAGAGGVVALDDEAAEEQHPVDAGFVLAGGRDVDDQAA